MPRVRACVTLFLFALLLPGPAARASAAPARRVLLLYSYEREFSHQSFASLFRPELSRTSPDPIDFSELSLQDVRASRTESDAMILDELRGTLGPHLPDLVVTLGGPAAAFVQKYRSVLFPGTPVLLAAVDSRFLDPAPLAPDEAAVTVKNDPLLVLNTILQVLPDTRTVLFVAGASKLEQFWVDEVKRTVKPLEGRVTFSFTNQLTLAEMLKRSASLPPHSAILYGVYSMDAAGAPQVEFSTLDALHAEANAPMFGLYSSQLGHGVVGGPLLSLTDLAHETADVALRLLGGQPASAIQPRIIVAGTPTFDARELRRWGISEARLRKDSTILYRDATPRRSGGLVAAAATFIGVQALLAIGLAVMLLRRRGGRRAWP